MTRDAEYSREWKRKRREQAATEGLPADVQHGLSTYVNWGCRCDTCKAANAARARRGQQKRAQAHEIPADANHGTYSAYTYYSCRCLWCWAAAVEYRRRKRQGLHQVKIDAPGLVARSMSHTGPF